MNKASRWLLYLLILGILIVLLGYLGWVIFFALAFFWLLRKSQRERRRRYFRRDEVLEVFNRNRGFFGFGKPSCQNCGSTKNLEIHHVKALSKDGNNDVKNLQLLCRKCNRRKGNN